MSLSLKAIAEVAHDLGIDPGHVVPYGNDKAKIALAAQRERPESKLILVSAITPTKAGEGKTTTSIGLAQGLAKIKRKAAVALREPSLGPTFGMKGGATGGGRSTVEPADAINLHFTGDFHAVSTANNLLAALLDNHLHFGNRLGIDVRRPFWRRVLDLNDRSLRRLVIGLGGMTDGVPRESGFDITPASEVMAVLGLAADADDLRQRLARLIVGVDGDGRPVTAAHLEAVGAMMAVLRDALMPNLVQTCEGVPAFIHCGPFANIAHGCNSVLATKMALSYADWVVTEAGFGADLGAEKFLDIKCVTAGLDPAAVVLVATARALKRHGEATGDAEEPDPAAVERGLPNLEKHVEILRLFGRDPVVTLNRFAADSDDEVEVVRAAAERYGVRFAVCDGFARGGDGATELAEQVVAQAEEADGPFQPLYERSDEPREKMRKIAEQVYGAGSIVYTRDAQKDLAALARLDLDRLPLCVAKTPMSLSDDASLVGRPEGFEISVRRVLPSTGAGFLVPLLGTTLRMPGLPSDPQARHIDLVDGKIVGLR